MIAKTYTDEELDCIKHIVDYIEGGICDFNVDLVAEKFGWPGEPTDILGALDDVYSINQCGHCGWTLPTSVREDIGEVICDDCWEEYYNS